jgi:hypothetical protein
MDVPRFLTVRSRPALSKTQTAETTMRFFMLPVPAAGPAAT